MPAATEDREKSPEAEAQTREPDPPEPIEVRVGMDDATGKSQNMLGAAVATPHQAPFAQVDQPALTTAAQQSGPAMAVGPAVPSPAANGETTHPPGDAAAAQAPPADAPPEPAPEQGEHRGSTSEDLGDPPSPQTPPASGSEETAPQTTERLLEDGPAPGELATLTSTFDLAILDQEFGLPASLAVPPALAAREATRPKARTEPHATASVAASPVGRSPSAPPAQASLAPQASGATTDDASPIPPGAQHADAESQAFSKLESLEYRPGMPLVGKGIRIRPAQPRLSITSRVTAGRIRNPVVLLKFNRAGKVAHANFVDGQTTGNPDWDGPIMDAVHRWTATGKALLELPENNPDATLAIQVTFILRD